MTQQEFKILFDENIKTEIIDLESGQIIDKDRYNDDLNPESFNITGLANSDDYGKEIPAELDKAGIKRQPKYMVVYIVNDENGVNKYILPLYGKGLWSTMYGFMALNKDLRTIEGFTFYQHGETPGLGGEVDNPKWKAQWKGKQAFDENWDISIQVIKGLVDKEGAKANSQIDGLSGSTLTTRGVDQLVKFWLGDQGYGSFFKNLRGNI